MHYHIALNGMVFHAYITSLYNIQIFPTLCSSAPDDMAGQTPTNPVGVLGGHIRREKIWRGRQKLSVYFMNPDDIEDWGWKTGDGDQINVTLVDSWARTWNNVQNQNIPRLKKTAHARQADIRVKFTGMLAKSTDVHVSDIITCLLYIPILYTEEGGNWSKVGTDAQKVRSIKEPTMQLNLYPQIPQDLQESLVIHEFGHALGLEHEHQRSDFWDVLREHLDLDAMKNDPYVNPSQSVSGRAAFRNDWFESSTGYDTNLSEYDPSSIMHYRWAIEPRLLYVAPASEQ